MIDTLVAMRPRIAEVDAAQRRGLSPGSYLVVTLHRPALVDGPLLGAAVAALDEIAKDMLVVFPIHPRTAASMQRQEPLRSRRRACACWSRWDTSSSSASSRIRPLF